MARVSMNPKVFGDAPSLIRTADLLIRRPSDAVRQPIEHHRTAATTGVSGLRCDSPMEPDGDLTRYTLGTHLTESEADPNDREHLFFKQGVRSKDPICLTF